MVCSPTSPCWVLHHGKNPPAGGFLPFAATRGFTLIELVVMILIIGILALTVLPRWRGNSGFEERAFRDELVASLRYAQKSAIAARRTVCVSFVAGPPAQANFAIAAFGAANCAAGVALIGPNGNPLQVTGRGSVSFTAPPGDIVFDAGGQVPVASAIQVAGLDAAWVIAVEAGTGYVH